MAKNILVLLDPGHGSNTPGKCSPDKSILEYEMNRRIASAVSEALTNLGISNKILVPETVDISLAERVRRANSEYAKSGKKAVFVSVHLNAAGAQGKWMSARGWSVFVSPNASTASMRLANSLFDAAVKNGLKTRQPEPKQKYWVQNLYVCKKTSCPAVLTENLFMDNKEDRDLLVSPAGFEKVVNTIVQGIQDYVNS